MLCSTLYVLWPSSVYSFYFRDWSVRRSSLPVDFVVTILLHSSCYYLYVSSSLSTYCITWIESLFFFSRTRQYTNTESVILVDKWVRKLILHYRWMSQIFNYINVYILSLFFCVMKGSTSSMLSLLLFFILLFTYSTP